MSMAGKVPNVERSEPEDRTLKAKRIALKDRARLLGNTSLQLCSLREWFAGQALSGLMADTAVRDAPSRFAAAAVTLADALLIELARDE